MYQCFHATTTTGIEHTRATSALAGMTVGGHTNEPNDVNLTWSHSYYIMSLCFYKICMNLLILSSILLINQRTTFVKSDIQKTSFQNVVVHSKKQETTSKKESIR